MRNSLRLMTVGALLVVGLVASSPAGAGLDDPRQEARELALASERHQPPGPTYPGIRLLASTHVMRVIVGVRETSELRQVARRLRAAGASIERLPELSAVASRGVSAAFVVELLRGDPAVTFIEEDRELAVLADPYDATDPATGLNYNWAYDAIAAGPAIAAVGGGSQFSVAVVDTGVDVSHADLAGPVVGSYSALDGGTDATDSLGHGTFVAGLISAIDGNALGGKGAAGATNLLAVRASSPGGEFYESQLADSIVWATEAGARVINLSLGGPCPSGALITSALEHAFAQGALVVAAAGNIHRLDAESGSAQLGHSPTMTLETYGHLIEELRDRPPLQAETLIREARNTGSASAAG